MVVLLTSHSAPEYSFIAAALSSFPVEPKPTKLAVRNGSQNAASLFFHAAYALRSSANRASLVGAAEVLPALEFAAVLVFFAAPAFAAVVLAAGSQAVSANAAIAANRKY